MRGKVSAYITRCEYESTPTTGTRLIQCALISKNSLHQTDSCQPNCKIRAQKIQRRTQNFFPFAINLELRDSEAELDGATVLVSDEIEMATAERNTANKMNTFNWSIILQVPTLNPSKRFDLETRTTQLSLFKFPTPRRPTCRKFGLSTVALMIIC